MNLSQYLTARLRELGLKRGDLPKILGYTNSNKCLRNLDRFLAGDFSHKELSYRILHSPLGGDDFQTVLLQAQHQCMVDLRELAKARELKESREFVPHFFFIHERSIPSPIHAVAFVGAEHFKKMVLPADMQEKMTEVDCLDSIEQYLISYVSNPPTARYTNSLFGRAVRILFRDQYDHAHVFDISELRFVGHFYDVPRRGHATLNHKGGQLWQ